MLEHHPRGGKRKLSVDDAPTAIYSQLATSSPVDITLPPKQRERMKHISTLRYTAYSGSKGLPPVLLPSSSERGLDGTAKISGSEHAQKRRLRKG